MHELGITHNHAAMRKDAPGELVALETAQLDKNQRIAERNRGWQAGRGVLAMNLMSSPGSGKKTLLVRTLNDPKSALTMSVVEGGQETAFDAERIRATGAAAVQINTGAGCHLEADMLERALRQLAPAAGSVLFIENVGNLVCPALFDLGERAQVVVLSGALAYTLGRSAARLTLLNGGFNMLVAGLSVLLGLRLLVVNG